MARFQQGSFTKATLAPYEAKSSEEVGNEWIRKLLSKALLVLIFVLLLSQSTLPSILGYLAVPRLLFQNPETCKIVGKEKNLFRRSLGEYTPSLSALVSIGLTPKIIGEFRCENCILKKQSQ